MNKITIIFASLLLFQTMLHAEKGQTADNTGSSTTTRKIIMPAFGNQYDLEGVQTHNGQYKSSYSTNAVDNRSTTDVQKRRDNQNDQHNNAGFHKKPVVPGVIIVIDE